MVQRGVEGVGCPGAVWVGICDDLLYGVWGELRLGELRPAGFAFQLRTGNG